MKYNFTSGAELLEKCKELNMTIHELCVEREAELTGISKEEVKDKMRVSLNIMKEAVEKVISDRESSVWSVSPSLEEESSLFCKPSSRLCSVMVDTLRFY